MPKRFKPLFLFTIVLTALFLSLSLMPLQHAVQADLSPPQKSTNQPLADHTTNPLSVTIAGDLQDELGCPGDWQPECDTTKLSYDANDDVWQAAWPVVSGTFNYKAALNNAWAENYGANATFDGPNISLNLTETMTVTFYYDHKSHWVTDNHNEVIVTAAGDFQAALGCSGDWLPDCLRAWLQDPDGDGTYAFETTALPAGNYLAKAAIGESWTENYGAGGVFDGDNIPFSVTEPGSNVTFSYDHTSHIMSITVESGLVISDLVQAPARHPIENDVFYFVMPDRFQTGDPGNDQGGLSGGPLDHGYDPTDKGFYHGGDLAGLLEKIDYLDQLGVTAIWMTPMFKNRPVQGRGADVSAGYHGYWITDFTQFDPHFGTNQELEMVITEAHSRGIKIFFDIITNHTADIIQYQEGTYDYISKEDAPYLDADGVAFDDRDYVDQFPLFPILSETLSFPYTPIYETITDSMVKSPAWLNDPTYYHNRGNSTFVGENSLYGDFFGLDDLFTEHPQVITGVTQIYKDWITNYDIDGFRVDTMKHVNYEFWEYFADEILSHAAAEGKPDFFIFGEVFSGNELLLSHYTVGADVPAILDFKFQENLRTYVSVGGNSDNLKALFEADDYYIDEDSNAYNLPTFTGNHDRGRFAYFLMEDNGTLSDTELLARSELAHAMMYFARGVPVIYYGDEQGFVGDGGDKDARQDMFPSQVDSYNDDDLIGTNSTTADDNFDQNHPLYQAFATYGNLYQSHETLQHGAQIHRYSTDTAGIYAFSRIDRDLKEEYVVAFNNTTTPQTASFPVYEANTTFTAVYTADDGSLATSLLSDGQAQITVTVPTLGFVIYQADAPTACSTTAPGVSVSNLVDDQVVSLEVYELDGNTINERIEVVAALDASIFAEVTFAVRESGSSDYTVIGVDDNPPYRVFYDPSALPGGTVILPDTPLDFIAIVNDLCGHYDSAAVNGIVPEYVAETGDSNIDHVIMHYFRDDGDYGDHTTGDYNDYWGLHLWGAGLNPAEATDWTDPLPFLGEDEYGRFAWANLDDASQDINFIIHRGDVKDGTPNDRAFNPAGDGPEIWLRQDDPTFYTSQAAAQGYVTLHYKRTDGAYYTDTTDYWGLHLWGEAIDPSEGTTWDAPKLPSGIDDYGAYYVISVTDVTQPVNFIVHKPSGDNTEPGGTQEPGGDRFFMPQETASIWLMAQDVAVYNQRGGAENFAILHYRRAAGDYGDYNSPDYTAYWGMHAWQDTTDTPGWTSPITPAGEDTFGVYYKVNLTDEAQQIGYILHRGDEKDPGPDQFLTFPTWGYEVWQLEAADPENPYILPLLVAAAGGGDLSVYRAHWLTEDTIAWDVEHNGSYAYHLYYAPDGGISLDNGVITGGQMITLTYAGGLSADLQANYPHLASYNAFTIDAGDLTLVPEMLKGQLAIAAHDENDTVVEATGLQIPGVLDDLYTYTGDLGISYNGPAPTLRLWAPTAKSVKLHIFETSTSSTPTAVITMTPGLSGTWAATGDATWTNKFYLYEVAVYVHSTGQVENNIVTDPYAFSLATNSTRSQIVDLLHDTALQPPGWNTLTKPALAAPEDIVLYELHVRDFSITDTTVSEANRGKFMAFTETDSDGMQHLLALAEAGLTHIHLLPVFDIATINENEGERVEPDITLPADPASEAPRDAVNAVADQDGFNWGYDPYHYTVPEGSYATDPDGPTRILEFRSMVKTLNENGLRVVMDVVYNHTNAAGQAEKSVLDKIVPGYYHRLELDGTVAQSTCCQNTATEHAMMEKLMVDSLVTWATAYKVDAFRFDLMGHHMKTNMVAVQEALAAVDPTIYIYGEGWDFGEVGSNQRGENGTQLNMAGTGIGTFNDRLRDAVRGGGPFDGGESLHFNQGFINGMFYDPNSFTMAQFTAQEQLDELTLSADQIRVGLAGNLADYTFEDRLGNMVSGAEVDYNGSPAGYTQDPQEHIVYISAHDNQTLFDISQFKHPTETVMMDRVRAQNMGLDITMLSQGVPFFHAGVDMLRSKSLERDSYNSGDWFNQLRFNYQRTNWGIGLPVKAEGDEALMTPLLRDTNLAPAQDDIMMSVAHMREMLQIRRSSPLFRLQTAEEVMARLTFHNTGPDQIPGLIVMRLSDQVGGSINTSIDPNYGSIVVLFNATDETQVFTETTLTGAMRQLHPVQAASADAVVKDSTFDSASGSFSIPARTTAVFVEVANPVALEDVGLSGPASGQTGVSYAFTATVSPVTATLPITYTWSATDQTDMTTTSNGTVNVAMYTWTSVGTKTITVTADNGVATVVSDTYTIVISTPPDSGYIVYMPLIMKGFGQ